MKILSMPVSGLLALAFVLGTSSAFCCSCPRSSYEQLVDSAEYVFVARIIAARLDHEAPAQEQDRVLVEFEPIDALKGEPGELDHLVGGLGGGDCGFPVVVGRTILVQTDHSGHLSICNGTRVAYVGFEPFDSFLESVRNHINTGTPIEPMEWDKHGPASHTNAEYR